MAGSWAGWVEAAGVNSDDNAGVHIIGTAGAQIMGVAVGAVLGTCLGVCAGVAVRCIPCWPAPPGMGVAMNRSP